jgi:hypothetical protein
MKRTLILSALLAASLQAEAQVRVSVKIDAPLMIAKYRPRTADAELAIATALARELPKYFSQWSFVPVARDQSEVRDFTLSFRIYEHLGAHMFGVELYAPAQRINGWNGLWMGPGEHLGRGFPGRVNAGKDLSAKIAELLLNAKQPDMFVEMKKVPLATTALWLPVIGRREEPRLVLPLRWPGSRVLINAIIRIDCAGTVYLRSQALDTPAFYDDRVSQRYEALVVRPLKHIAGQVETDVRNMRRKIMTMKPVAIYLETPDPMALQSPGVVR